MKSHSRALIQLLREKLPEVKLGAEVGVWQGGNSAALLRAFPRLLLWMVDPWDSIPATPTMPATHEELREAERLAIAATGFADSRRIVIKRTSSQAQGLINPQSLDFVFIDACHLYEIEPGTGLGGMAEDVKVWWPKVRPEGVFCGHDYNGKMDRAGRWGVKRAVDEFAERYGLQVKTKGLTWWVENI